MIFAADAFAGRQILVTGASSGLGKEAAIQLSRCGAEVALMGRNEERLIGTLAELAGQGHTVHAGDLTDAEVASDVVAAVAKAKGGLHGVFHSAGTALVQPARLTKNRHLDDVFAAGFRGAFGVARAGARKGVIHDGGSLVFMSSISAIRGRPGMTAYSASKAAVDGMVRVLAGELNDRKIRVNSVLAGAVATTMHNEFVEQMSEEIIRNYENLHLLGFGRPEDVAYAAMFLLSDASRWITGTNMIVDGGYAAK